MLNPQLFHCLQQAMPGEWRVTKEDELREAGKSGEHYIGPCPWCGKALKLSVSYTNFRPGGHTNLCRCFACGKGPTELAWQFNLRSRLQDMGTGGMQAPVTIPSMPTESEVLGEEDPVDDVDARLPDGCVPFGSLSVNHPARVFVREKYHASMENLFDHMAWYCGKWDSRWPAAKGRIIWPLTDDGVLIGWQGRAVFGQEPKYTQPSGMIKSVWNLDNLDPAVDAPVVAEGIPSAMACGRQGVAILGKEATPLQLDRLSRFKRVILALDPQTFTPDPHTGVVYADKLAQALRQRGVVVELWRWPEGDMQDPADHGLAAMKDLDGCVCVFDYDQYVPQDRPVDSREPVFPTDTLLQDNVWVYDLEVYPNYFLGLFTNGRQWLWFYHTTLDALRTFLDDAQKILAGFNNAAYDDLILTYILHNPGCTMGDLYRLSTRLIMGESEEDKGERFDLGYCKDRPWWGSIDVMQLLRGKRALKELQASRGEALVLESPIPFDSDLRQCDIQPVTAYCANDVTSTRNLLISEWDKVMIRNEVLDMFPDVGRRIYSQAEAKIAERVFMTQHRNRTGETRRAVDSRRDSDPDNTAASYAMNELLPPWIRMVSPGFKENLQKLANDGRVVRVGKRWALQDCPMEWALDDQTVFQLGVGGLHSKDGPGVFNEADGPIIDLDVTSYYPSLILGLGLMPPQIGQGFYDDYRAVVNDRVAAKKAGNTGKADAYKLILNSTYGKLNDQYSPLYCPKQAWRVTIAGQLYLLLLADLFHACGYSVLSVNTDGMTVQHRNGTEVQQPVDTLVDSWEEVVGGFLKLERQDYSFIVRRDVNNYMAMTTDGKVKLKGCYGGGNKNQAPVVRQAAIEWLTNGVPIRETLEAEQDVLQFAYNARVRGATIETEEGRCLGSITRWVVGAGSNRLYRVAGEKRVALGRSQGYVLADDLTTGCGRELRSLVNIDFYEAEARALADVQAVEV